MYRCNHCGNNRFILDTSDINFQHREIPVTCLSCSQSLWLPGRIYEHSHPASQPLLSPTPPDVRSGMIEAHKLPDRWSYHSNGSDPRTAGFLEMSWATMDIWDGPIADDPEEAYDKCIPSPLELAERLEQVALGIRALTEGPGRPLRLPERIN